MTTTEEADAAYWQGRSVGILVGAAQATADAEEERLALVVRAERAEGIVARIHDLKATRWHGIPAWGPDERGLMILEEVDLGSLMDDLDWLLTGEGDR